MKLNLEVKGNKIRPNSGIYVIEELIRKNQINTYIDSLFADRYKQACYKDSDILLGLSYSIFSGGGFLEDVNFVRQELSHSYLQIPSADTIGYRARQLATPTQTCISKRGIEHFFNTNPGLNEALVKLGVRLNPKWKTHAQTADYDNTIVPTARPDSLTAYKSGPAYQPGTLMIEGMPVYIEGRNGNSPSRYLMDDTLERGFERLTAAGVRIGALRIDGAGHQQAIYTFLSKHPTIKYYIRADKAPLGHLKGWKKAKLGGEKVEVLSHSWRTPGADRNDCRLVAYRILRVNGEQDLFDGKYEYHLLLTNDWKRSAVQVIEFYNQRGRAEQTYDIMKNDFNWKHLAFGNLMDNTVYLLLTAMAYLIYRWALRIISRFFPALTPNTRLKRFILYFVNTPGKWIRSAHSTRLVLYTCQPYPELLKAG